MVLEDCLPLAEEKFKKVIQDNYYTKTKFNCQLTSQQVLIILRVFSFNIPIKVGIDSCSGFIFYVPLMQYTLRAIEMLNLEFCREKNRGRGQIEKSLW